jgi:A/G-specific adenine glycosylase
VDFSKKPAGRGWFFVFVAALQPRNGHVPVCITIAGIMPPKAAQLGNRQIRSLRTRLLGWFDREKRTLPWRGERNPYRILVSEIMLQQTRVAVVVDRYRQFLRQFPTVERLARAREQTVLAAWSGLGYYRRARALRAAAKQIASLGRFPRNAAHLADLPGVGRYTSAAVASIAFGEPVPVVDGNVQRVLQRLFKGSFSSEQYWQAAARLLDAARPGDFNQAMMELGALVCLPARPLCQKCPMARICVSRGAETARRQSPRRKAILNLALARRNGRVLLEQRPATSSLMPLMWDMPALTKRPETTPALKLRHSITNTDYHVSVFADSQHGARQATGRWVALRSAPNLPLTGLARKILVRLELLPATRR